MSGRVAGGIDACAGEDRGLADECTRKCAEVLLHVGARMTEEKMATKKAAETCMTVNTMRTAVLSSRPHA